MICRRLFHLEKYQLSDLARCLCQSKNSLWQLWRGATLVIIVPFVIQNDF
jgi:hypothetical protein